VWYVNYDNTKELNSNARRISHVVLVALSCGIGAFSEVLLGCKSWVELLVTCLDESLG
jgi:hypothetical protein